MEYNQFKCNVRLYFSAPTQTFSDLSAATSYDVTVNADSTVGVSNQISGSFMTKVPKPVVSSPINVSLNRAQIMWTNSWNVSENPPTYVLEYSAVGSAVDPIRVEVNGKLLQIKSNQRLLR